MRGLRQAIELGSHTTPVCYLRPESYQIADLVTKTVNGLVITAPIRLTKTERWPMAPATQGNDLEVRFHRNEMVESAFSCYRLGKQGYNTQRRGEGERSYEKQRDG